MRGTRGQKRRSRRYHSAFRCHSPRRRGIQYAAASRFNHRRHGVLDRPPLCAIAHWAGDDTECVAAACPKLLAMPPATSSPPAPAPSPRPTPGIA
ncbi:hypothetical protein F8237_15935 [Bradyrhizobium betae]|uniref:Uncharacterized protein n=1 Tax=Bradyrhizobium betae TaxID=244734 RepID=A0A5P6P6C0_9BRAD|nr:hypothetical protein F8237_15935 [Bradyrhizobium betae]